MTAPHRSLLALAPLGVLLVLVSCVGRLGGPQASAAPTARALQPTVALSFDQLNADSYPELKFPPKSGVTVESLRARHDTQLFSEARTRWGREQQFTVLEFTDSDRPTRSIGATSAWFLGPDPGDGAPEVVGAVLFRDFEDAPLAEDPHQLLGLLAARFPSPWLLCRPTQPSASDLLMAYDSERGIKLALLRQRDGEKLWSVDHVEFVSTLLPLEQWWGEKGYGECAVEDRVMW